MSASSESDDISAPKGRPVAVFDLPRTSSRSILSEIWGTYSRLRKLRIDKRNPSANLRGCEAFDDGVAVRNLRLRVLLRHGLRVRKSTSASFFGEEPSMPIFDSPQPAESCDDAWMAALGSSPGNARTALSFFAGNIQNQTYWILVDSGSVRNLIDDRVFDSLPFQPPLRQRDVQIFGGNGGALSIRGFAVLPVVICGVILWHEFAVVHELPLRAIIGADILQPHLASLSYLNGEQKRLELGVGECAICKEKKTLMTEGYAAQIRYVERNVKELRNRYQIEDGFMAVLPLKEVPIRIGEATAVRPPANVRAGPPLVNQQDSQRTSDGSSEQTRPKFDEFRWNGVGTPESRSEPLVLSCRGSDDILQQNRMRMMQSRRESTRKGRFNTYYRN